MVNFKEYLKHGNVDLEVLQLIPEFEGSQNIILQRVSSGFMPECFFTLTALHSFDLLETPPDEHTWLYPRDSIDREDFSYNGVTMYWMWTCLGGKEEFMRIFKAFEDDENLRNTAPLDYIKRRVGRVVALDLYDELLDGLVFKVKDKNQKIESVFFDEADLRNMQHWITFLDPADSFWN